jgi:hypothetical protein
MSFPSPDGRSGTPVHITWSGGAPGGVDGAWNTSSAADVDVLVL